MSLRASMSVRASHCSGDMYSGVPAGASSLVVSMRSAAHLAHQAEIEQLRAQRLVDEHVFGLQIAVHQAAAVRDLDDAQDRERVARELVDLHRALERARGVRTSTSALTNSITTYADPFQQTAIEHGRDVGDADRGQRVGLAQQRFAGRGVVRARDLDGDRLSVRRALGEEHRAEAALPQRLDARGTPAGRAAEPRTASSSPRWAAARAAADRASGQTGAASRIRRPQVGQRIIEPRILCAAA